MRNTNTLTFMKDTKYNNPLKNPGMTPPILNELVSTQFMAQTKRALILRENILASGMEPSDLCVAESLYATLKE